MEFSWSFSFHQIQRRVVQPDSRSARVRRRSGRSGVQHDERAGTDARTILSSDLVVSEKLTLYRL